MSFGEVAAAAIRFAREGFPDLSVPRRAARRPAEGFSRWPSTAAIFLPGGRPPAGRARSLCRAISAERCSTWQIRSRRTRGGDRLAGLQAARDAFYRGDIATAIVRHQRENGGWIAAEDLESFQSPVEPPCRIRFGEFEVHGCGAWSQGPMVLEALNILQGLDLRGDGPQLTPPTSTP